MPRILNRKRLRIDAKEPAVEVKLWRKRLSFAAKNKMAVKDVVADKEKIATKVSPALLGFIPISGSP